MRVCPICREAAVQWHRCPLQDCKCGNGHKWHYCLAHEGNLKTVIGTSDHSKPTNECCCQEEEKTMNKVPICPNCQAENMPEDEALNEALALGEGEVECSSCRAIYKYEVELGLMFT